MRLGSFFWRLLWPLSVSPLYCVSASGFGLSAVHPLRTDPVGYAAIAVREDRLARGLFGDHKSVGNGVWELRINTGPGYRIYYARAGKVVVLLLCGGNKRSRQSDIKAAKTYWRDYEQRTQACGGSR